MPPPSEYYEDLRTAPPMLSALSFEDPFFDTRIDPYENTPSTAALATFPSVSSTSITPTQDDDSPTSLRNSKSPTSQHLRVGGSHHHLFGRTPSGRHYPRGDSVDDKEESQSLWRGSDSPDLDPAEASVRLVSSQPRQQQQSPPF